MTIPFARKIVVKDTLSGDIDEVVRQMARCDAMFDLIEDEDLMDSVIYEQKALTARYHYLLKTARERERSAKGGEDATCLTRSVSEASW